VALRRPETLDFLNDRVVELTKALIWRSYDQLPRVDSGQAARRLTLSGLIKFARQLVLAILPGAVLIVTEALDWRLPESLRPAAGIVATIWLLVTLMLLIDPAIRDKLGLTKDFISVLKPTSKDGKE
jgi:hypothetical protein